MIDYPYLKELPTSRKTVEVFRGLNRNARIGDGEFCEMENLTSDHYPVLATRGERGRNSKVANPNGMFRVPGRALYYSDGDKLYMHSGDTNFLIAEGLIETQVRRQFALMGTSLIIAPDMKWLDIRNPLSGLNDMGADLQVNTGTVTVSLCKSDGDSYPNVTVDKKSPTNPENMALWLDTSIVPNVLRQYSELGDEWVAIPTTHLKISGLTGHPFSEGDAVTISGIEAHAPQHIYHMKGAKVIEAKGSDYIVIAGITDQEYSQACDRYPLTISREVPQLDFIVEAGNRLWGCCQGTNEIYASKLGDFKNWNVFSGLSTDSWVGNVGTSGNFTGAINHGGYPVFYKENFKHKVWPSSTGAHQIASTPCLGVKNDCYGSMALYNERLLYLSPGGVCLDDGSGPVTVDQALCSLAYNKATGAVHQHKYYLSVDDRDEKRHLLVYDLRNGLWYREDSSAFYDMASHDGCLYAAGTGYLWDLTGQTGTPEGQVSWRAVTGDLVESPERKYISRLTLRMSLEPGSRVDIYARYDHEEGLTKLGTAYGRKLGSFSLPVRPRRCDHLQLELRGKGAAKIYSITKTFSEGSELR